MDAFREYLSAKKPESAAPMKAPSWRRAVMTLCTCKRGSSQSRLQAHPRFQPALDVAASSMSGKSSLNFGITRTMDSRPWSKPNRNPPIHATRAHPITRPFAKISLIPGSVSPSDVAHVDLTGCTYRFRRKPARGRQSHGSGRWFEGVIVRQSFPMLLYLPAPVHCPC